MGSSMHMAAQMRRGEHRQGFLPAPKPAAGSIHGNVKDLQDPSPRSNNMTCHDGLC